MTARGHAIGKPAHEAKTLVEKKYKADAGGVVRFPALPVEVLEQLSAGPLSDVVSRMWSDRRIRDAVQLASSSLFTRIQEKADTWVEDHDICAALARYLLRMSFRPTPFGGFAGVGFVGSGSSEESTLTIPANEDRLLRSSLDWHVLQELEMYASRNIESVNPRLHLNDSLVRYPSHYWFLAYRRDKKGNRKFRSIELERSGELDELFSFVSSGRKYTEIVKYLSLPENSESSEEAKATVKELCRLQVLSTDSLLPLACGDVLQEFLDGVDEEAEVCGVIKRVRIALESRRSVQELWDEVGQEVGSIGVAIQGKQLLKAELFDTRPCAGEVSWRVYEEVANVISDIAEHVPRGGDLQAFIQAFESRYGDGEVPFPEVIKSLESLGFMSQQAAPTLASLVKERAREPDVRASFVPQLLHAMHKASDERLAYVDIDHVVPAPRRSRAGDSDDPPLVAWLSMWRDSSGQSVVEIKSLGRQDPGRVMGRFAHGLPRLRDYLIADADLAGQDGSIVAEIVHKPSAGGLNVAARATLSKYELRLRGGGSGDQVQAVDIEDLVLGVSAGRVYLRRRTDKRLVRLRMSSAHAFSKQGNLPVYNFLNALSNQGEVVRIPTLADIYPTAEFLPGVRFKGTIIGRPRWRPSRAFREELRRLPHPLAVDRLIERLKELPFPSWIILKQGDNELPLSSGNRWMMEELTTAFRSLGELSIEDALPDGLQPALAGEDGTYSHEIQVAFRQQKRIERSGKQDPPSKLHWPGSDACVSPWGEWTYFRVYVPRHRQNEFLSGLSEVIYEEGNSDKLFFVRYEDAKGAHLRLRIRGAIHEVLGKRELRSSLDDAWSSGLLSTFEVSPYHREYSRYGGLESCRACETVFALDSNMVISHGLNQSEAGAETWLHHAASANAYLIGMGLSSLATRRQFATRAAAEFSHEHGFGSKHNKSIGAVFRSTRGSFDKYHELLVPQARGRSEWLEGSWAKVREAGNSGSISYSLMWSVIHMHFNRALTADHRLQEAVIWELLKRMYVLEEAVGPASTRSQI